MKSKLSFLPYLIIIIVGVVIAGGSYLYLNGGNYAEEVETKPVHVVNRNLEIYQPIRNRDLKVIDVPATTNIEKYFTEPEKIVGKITTTPLKENDFIHQSILIESEEIEHIEFVTMNVNYGTSGGARPGDIVDIYRVIPSRSEQWSPGSDTKVVAKDALVVSLKSSGGQSSLADGFNPLSEASDGNLETVKLAVDQRFVKGLVPGSVTGESGYVLVTKNHGNNLEIVHDEEIKQIIENKEQENIVEETEETEDETEEEGEKSDVEKIFDKEKQEGEDGDGDDEGGEE